MKTIFAIVLLSGFSFLSIPSLSLGGETNVQLLQDISCTISSDGSQGSGVIKTRQMNGEPVNFVWTAAHVVSGLRRPRSVVDSKSGTPKVIVEFNDAKVIKILVEEGRDVGKMEMFAEVIRYNAEEDFALLRLRKRGYVNKSVTFYLDVDAKGNDKLPNLASDVVHVGSLLGEVGSNSITKGIISQHGRLVEGKVFDQTTATSFPGSSGGGIYLDNQCIGLVLRGAGEGFNLIGPVRRLHKWAKSAQVEWAVDDRIPMPSDEELKKLPIEDSGANFTYNVAEAKPKNHLLFIPADTKIPFNTEHLD